MDQIKIGKFIASCRKEQDMTQAVLAEKLGISDRAISKWETGKSMPDSGIMLELCELLKINVNELLSGERIMAEAYDKRAEENLLAMARQKEEKDRQLLHLEYVVGFTASITFMIMIFVGSYLANGELAQSIAYCGGKRDICGWYWKCSKNRTDCRIL